MSHIGMTEFKFDVEPLRAQLQSHPEIWNEVPHRTIQPTSPHREVDDIWVRYNSLDNLRGDWTEFNGPHESVWYPVVSKIPAVKQLSLELFNRLHGKQLGGILLTRVPSRKMVYPHVDQGWHAGYYEKYVIQVKGHVNQAFCFEGEELRALTGECYWFDNAFEHWVYNYSDEERISLIVCLRRD